MDPLRPQMPSFTGPSEPNPTSPPEQTPPVAAAAGLPTAGQKAGIAVGSIGKSSVTPIPSHIP